MAFASAVTDRTAHLPKNGDDEGTVFGFSFTLAKTFTADPRGTSRPSDAASHTDPGRERGPRRGAPRAPADA